MITAVPSSLRLYEWCTASPDVCVVINLGLMGAPGLLTSSLSVLRYQFNPAFFQTTVTAQILLKALTNLPHTDFTLCKCMIDQAHVSFPGSSWHAPLAPSGLSNCSGL